MINGAFFYLTEMDSQYAEEGLWIEEFGIHII